MITEDYVSFETAKLLKKKGFDAYCVKFYNNLNQDRIFELYNAQQLERASVVSNKILDDYLPTLQVKSIGYVAPTLQMAMKWLRDQHNLHIMVDCIGSKNYIPTIQFIRNSKDIMVKSDENKIGGRGFDSFEEACESAIKYCLENLI